MTVVVLFPGFGYEVVDRDVAQRQPWNYLLQITENLVTNGYRVRVYFHNTKPRDELVKDLFEKGIDVCQSLSLNRNDFVIVPFAVGYYIKLYKKIYWWIKELDSKVYIALTTYLSGIGELLTNYILVKLTRTGKTIGKTLAENIALRIWRNDLLSHITGIITPSRDYIEILLSLGLKKETDVVEFVPQVDVLVCHDNTNESNNVEGRKVVTYFGPFDEERGVFSLINAYIEFIEGMYPDTVLKLLIRGDGYPLPLGVIKKIRDRSIVVREKFEDKRTLFRELCSSKLIILPYRVIPSTIPISYLEALFLDNPLVIATGIPGFKEHVCSYLDKTIPGTYRYKELADYIASLLGSVKDLNSLKTKQSNYVRSLTDKIQRQVIIFSK